MKIILESIVDSIASKVDGTISIKISTQELDPTNAGNIFALRGKFIKCLLSDSNITKLEEELIDNTILVSGKKNKSESQRLRAVLFRIHEQKDITEDFEIYYKNEMNKIIEHYKSKLE
jgi:hypothetical protein